MSSTETQQLGNIIDAATGDHERGFFLWHEGTGLKNNDVMTCEGDGLNALTYQRS